MSGRVTAALKRTAHVVLAVVAIVGVVLSWASLYRAARPTFGPILAAGFPLLVDALAAGASLMYVAGAQQGRGRPGWRLTAHAAIAGTVALNALAAPSVGDVPWHVTAPAVWAVLVELYGREALGQWRTEHVEAAERIPARLWLTAPIESARTWLRQGRTGVLDHADARLDVGLHAAAGEALRLALPDRNGRRVRRVLGRQLRAGSMPPAAVLAAIGWSGTAAGPSSPEAVLRAALSGVLAPEDSAEPVDTAEDDDAATVPSAAPETADLGSVAGGSGVGSLEPAEPEAVAAPATPAPVRRRPAGRRKAPDKAPDADLIGRISAAVDAGELAAEHVTATRVRALVGVGGPRAERLAHAWHDHHRRERLAAVAR
jgi:hypothetical protein